jgi:hypothetical protein
MTAWTNRPDLPRLERIVDPVCPVKPFNFFSWDMIEAIAQHNVPTVIVGMERLYRPILKFLNRALGYDMLSHFADDMKSKSMVLYFSAEETAFYYQRIKALCDTHGLRFSTCYIGNDETGESFDSYQNLWTNLDDCCDAIGNVQAFQTTCETLQLVTLT